MKHLPPQNTPPVDDKGQMSQAWTNWLAGVARRSDGSSWQVGDYRPSLSDNLGPNWLPCDGGSFISRSFPLLEAMLATITPASATGGRRFLPTIGSTFDAARPAPDGPPVMRWWIKAA